MENRSLVTIAEHSKEKILYMLEMAKEFEAKPNRHLLDEKVVATLFFEPSTRTRLSFETAANRLGARVIGFSDPKATSSSKGETLKDTIKMVSNYADIIVMRHYLEGAARYASEVTTIPIVNAETAQVVHHVIAGDDVSVDIRGDPRLVHAVVSHEADKRAGDAAALL